MQIVYKILHLDKNHELMLEQLQQAGFENHEDYTSTKEEIQQKISTYDGIILRSRFKIDKAFIDAATNLKFIGRVGAGLENIDCEYAQTKGIKLIAAPEGNRTAVGEHAMGMLLCLMNKLNLVDQEVRTGTWLREQNRGFEIEGKTVGIIGYGHMGKAFAQRLKGFNCKVICYDIKANVGDANAQQVTLNELFQQTDILSLHTPQTANTYHLINEFFIASFKKSFWFINTARGKSVDTRALVDALESKKILGAGLDVLEYEKSSFENMFSENELPEPMQYLIQAKNVLLSPHIAGWTIESKKKLAQVIVDKILFNFTDQNNVPNQQQASTINHNALPNYLNNLPESKIESQKILAGILAITLGQFGVHKFLLGYTTEGAIMVIITFVGYLTACFFVGYFLIIAIALIGFIEGIVYLTQSNSEFYRNHILKNKPWF